MSKADLAYVFVAYIELVVMGLIGSSVLTFSTYLIRSLYAVNDNTETHVAVMHSWVILYPTFAVAVAAALQMMLGSLNGNGSDYMMQFVAHAHVLVTTIVAACYYVALVGC